MPVDQDFDDHNRAATRYQSSYVSPWTNRFYSPSHAVPGPSNYYLPVATPHEYTQFIVRPYQPWMRQVVKLPLHPGIPSPSLLCASIWTLFMCGQSFHFLSCLLTPISTSRPIPFPSLCSPGLTLSPETQSQLILCRFVVRDNVLILSAGHPTHTLRLVWLVFLRHLLTILISVCLSSPAKHLYLSNNNHLQQHNHFITSCLVTNDHRNAYNSLPVPGITYNPAFPPKNPPPGVAGLRPGVSVVRPDTNSIADGEEDEYNVDGGDSKIPSRFGADGLDDDRFIFDIEERTTTTKRPFRTFSQTPPPCKATDK